jgi:hypothetical protein
LERDAGAPEDGAELNRRPEDVTEKHGVAKDSAEGVA